MLIAHLPAGYLAASAALRRVPPAQRRLALGAALVGSVLPDADLVYFYGVDSSVHHHALPTHWPLLWLAVLGVSALLFAITDRAGVGVAGVALSLAALLHIALDTVAGSVRWLAPFSDHATTLVTVPPTHSSWIVSFVTHWTFGVELAIAVLGLVVWLRRR